MTQDAFDFEAAQALRDAGLDRACNPAFRQELLESARRHARELASVFGVVTIDQVKRRMLNYGEEPDLLGNAAGRVFLTGEWEYVDRVRSERKRRHAGGISSWRLRV